MGLQRTSQKRRLLWICAQLRPVKELVTIAPLHPPLLHQKHSGVFKFILTLCGCAQLWPTLCDPMDCSPSGSSVHGILQARILEQVAISFSRGSSWPRDRTRASRTAGRFFSTVHRGKPWWEATERLSRPPFVWLSTNSCPSTAHRWRAGQLAKSEQSIFRLLRTVLTQKFFQNHFTFFHIEMVNAAGYRHGSLN